MILKRFFLTISIFCVALSAQETINFASVGGRVTDESGAVVQGAGVTARHLETNLTNTTKADSDGRFRFPYLKVGTYEIRIHQQGFSDAARTVTLTIGAAFDLPVTLAVGSTETNVTVSAEGAVLEAARSQVAGTVSQTEVQNLP